MCRTSHVCVVHCFSSCLSGIVYPLHSLPGELATVNSVLEGMEEASWIHLACHAVQRPSSPTESAFCLHNGDLTLSKIITKSFRNTDFAFLSACQTATGDENLPDEAVHLAAGMLAAV
jgi:CHAT domain-containing protein